MIARREIVEFISEITVTTIRQHLDENSHPSQNPRHADSAVKGMFLVTDSVFRHNIRKLSHRASGLHRRLSPSLSARLRHSHRSPTAEAGHRIGRGLPLQAA